MDEHKVVVSKTQRRLGLATESIQNDEETKLKLIAGNQVALSYWTINQ